VKLVRHRRSKAASSPYMQIIDVKHVAILWDMGHTKQTPCTGGIEQGKETKNLNVVDVLMVQE
jgi:hypothetical protein